MQTTLFPPVAEKKSPFLYKYAIKIPILAYICRNSAIFAAVFRINMQGMKKKSDRLAAIKMLVSSQHISSQEELLQALNNQGFALTQATLSRDLKSLNVAKAMTPTGKYYYVLPNDVLYKRPEHSDTDTRLVNYGFQSLHFSGNIAVIRTRPGYASSMAYDIDTHDYPGILGTIAGDDTIMMVLSEETTPRLIRHFLAEIFPNVK